MFVQMISSELQNILLLNLVWWCIITSWSVFQNNWFAILKVKVTMSVHLWSKYDSFYNIFWTSFYNIFWNANPFATKLGLVVQYHKPECLMKKLGCCVQGQGYHKTSKCKWMFPQKTSSEQLNPLLPNLVWWCIIMSQSVSQKVWFAVFKVKVTVKDHIIKRWLSNMSFEVPILLHL